MCVKRPEYPAPLKPLYCAADTQASHSYRYQPELAAYPGETLDINLWFRPIGLSTSMAGLSAGSGQVCVCARARARVCVCVCVCAAQAGL